MNIDDEVIRLLSNNIRTLIKNNINLNSVEEIRLRVNRPVIFLSTNNEIVTDYCATSEDINTAMQRFIKYSMYTFKEEIKKGYVTIKGGHRIGICGDCVIEDGKIKTIKNISSINIRICKQIKIDVENILPFLVKGNILLNTILISPPKCGKTTLLREITKNVSNGCNKLGLSGKKVCVIDERSEICGCSNGIPQMDIGIRTDVLDNCPKSKGIIMGIRSMGPEVIVCDEIGTHKDVESIVFALNSGVSVITTIHGYNENDLYRRKVFKEILDNFVFERAVILSNKNGPGTIEYIYDFINRKKVWERTI